MFKSQLEPSAENFVETQIFVENIFDTVKKAREAKAARSLAESKLAHYDYSFDFSPSKRKKTRKNAKSKSASKGVNKGKPTTPKKKPRKPRTPKDSSEKKKKTPTTPKTPRKYTKRAKVKPQNDIDDEEAAFILSSISQRSFDSFYNRLNGNSHTTVNKIQIPLETVVTQPVPAPQPAAAPPAVKDELAQKHALAYHHVLLDHNYWIVEPRVEPEKPQSGVNMLMTVAANEQQPAQPTQASKTEVNNNNVNGESQSQQQQPNNAVKKRWLRQATTETVTPPETSPNSDMAKAPLKKRPAAREIDDEIKIVASCETERSSLSHASVIQGPIGHHAGAVMKNNLMYGIQMSSPVDVNAIYGRNLVQENHSIKIEPGYARSSSGAEVKPLYPPQQFDDNLIKLEPETSQNFRNNNVSIVEVKFNERIPQGYNIKPEFHETSIKTEPFDAKPPKVEPEKLVTVDGKLQQLLDGKIHRIYSNEPQKVEFYENLERNNHVMMSPKGQLKGFPSPTKIQISPTRTYEIYTKNPHENIAESLLKLQQESPVKLLQSVIQKSPKKSPKPAKVPKSPKVKKVKPKKSPQKPKKVKTPKKTKKNAKVDKSLIKNFTNLEDVPLKIRQNLSMNEEVLIKMKEKPVPTISNFNHLIPQFEPQNMLGNKIFNDIEVQKSLKRTISESSSGSGKSAKRAAEAMKSPTKNAIKKLKFDDFAGDDCEMKMKNLMEGIGSETNKLWNATTVDCRGNRQVEVNATAVREPHQSTPSVFIPPADKSSSTLLPESPLKSLNKIISPRKLDFDSITPMKIAQNHQSDVLNMRKEPSRDYPNNNQLEPVYSDSDTDTAESETEDLVNVARIDKKVYKKPANLPKIEKKEQKVASFEPKIVNKVVNVEVEPVEIIKSVKEAETRSSMDLEAKKIKFVESKAVLPPKKHPETNLEGILKCPTESLQKIDSAGGSLQKVNSKIEILQKVNSKIEILQKVEPVCTEQDVALNRSIVKSEAIAENNYKNNSTLSTVIEKTLNSSIQTFGTSTDKALEIPTEKASKTGIVTENRSIVEANVSSLMENGLNRSSSSEKSQVATVNVGHHIKVSEMPLKLDSTAEVSLKVESSVENLQKVDSCGAGLQKVNKTVESLQKIEPKVKNRKKANSRFESLQKANSTNKNLQSDDSTNGSLQKIDTSVVNLQKTISGSESLPADINDENLQKLSSSHKCLQKIVSSAESLQKEDSAIESLIKADPKSRSLQNVDSRDKSLQISSSITESLQKEESVPESLQNAITGNHSLQKDDSTLKSLQKACSRFESPQKVDSTIQSLQNSSSLAEASLELSNLKEKSSKSNTLSQAGSVLLENSSNSNNMSKKSPETDTTLKDNKTLQTQAETANSTIVELPAEDKLQSPPAQPEQAISDVPAQESNPLDILTSIKSIVDTSITTTLESPLKPVVEQQVASILEKVIPKTLKIATESEEVDENEAGSDIDDEDVTAYREAVEEFHKDTLEKLMTANKRFCRESFVHNPFKHSLSYDGSRRDESYGSRHDDPRKGIKASLSFDSHQNYQFQPHFQRSMSDYNDPRKERWNGSYENRSYGSFHYDKIHHREPITTTYSMYRAQKASQWNNRPNYEYPPEPPRQVNNFVQEVAVQPPQVVAPPVVINTYRPAEQVKEVSPQAEALKSATSDPFGGFLKEKIAVGTAALPKTKTASHDPRLNPSLVVDVKKDEPATPKKKLSLDQYRKRKSLTSMPTSSSSPSDEITPSLSESSSPTLPPAFDPTIAAAAATG